MREHDVASWHLACIVACVSMFATALLLVQFGWSFWDRQGPIWLVGVVSGWLTLWRLASVRVKATDDEQVG